MQSTRAHVVTNVYGLWTDITSRVSCRADANVELRCGGNVVAGAKTSSDGSFKMEADMTNALSALVAACELVVDTPLVKCDGKLPAAGALVSYLQGPLARVLSGVFQLAPAGFSFQMS